MQGANERVLKEPDPDESGQLAHCSLALLVPHHIFTPTPGLEGGRIRKPSVVQNEEAPRAASQLSAQQPVAAPR
eukprot:scaffold6725_cov117-Isochrysis_galbana.AAC.7